MAEDRRVAIHKGSLTALTNLGPTWEDSWQALLAKDRALSDVGEIFKELSPGPPVAAIKHWGGPPPPFEKRMRTIAARISHDLAGPTACMQQRSKSARVSVMLATSHGESGVIARVSDTGVIGSDVVFDEELAVSVLNEDLLSSAIPGLAAHLPGMTMSGACATASASVGLASERIMRGICDATAVVAVDGLSRVAYAGFRRIGAMAKDECRPFDNKRDGTIMGEAGVGLLLAHHEMLSPEETAGYVLGFGMNCDARHQVEPNTDGAQYAVDSALRDAHVLPNEVSAVIWHGTGTGHNDRVEAEVSLRVFGDTPPPSTTTKGAFGHTMGASAGLSILTACEALRSGTLPVSVGTRDVAFPWIDLVLQRPRRIRPGPVLVLALGFGGINNALVIGSPQ